MYKRILVPLDGSPLSERVLPAARLLGRAMDAAIDLILVIGTPEEEMPPEFGRQARMEGEEYLRKIAASFSGDIDQSKLSYSLLNGHPASLIIERAEAHEATLVLMSSHGYSGVQRMLLGTVAGKVVQAASTPVLLIPANASSPEGDLVKFERIIVPLDGSRLAEAVLPHALALCRSLSMELILVRSYEPDFPGTSIRMHEVSKIVHDAAENYIRAKAEELQTAGLAQVSYRVFRGQPSDQIIKFAIETPNSLTAMTTHGRQGIGRWLLGSVTNAVIHCSEEPVLVVRSANGEG